MSLLILASSSPRRKFLLEMAGFDFQVHPSRLDEVADKGLSPAETALSLAESKGMDVAGTFSDAVILAADTIVFLNNSLLGKPSDTDEAIQMLRSLSGRTHEVITGVSLIRTDSKGILIDKTSFFVTTKVSFAELSDQEIKVYVDSGSPMDKAGAYGIQDDRGALYISRIDGDYYNVVGLPLHRLYTTMKKFAPELLKGVTI